MVNFHVEGVFKLQHVQTSENFLFYFIFIFSQVLASWKHYFSLLLYKQTLCPLLLPHTHTHTHWSESGEPVILVFTKPGCISNAHIGYNLLNRGKRPKPWRKPADQISSGIFEKIPGPHSEFWRSAVWHCLLDTSLAMSPRFSWVFCQEN